MGDLNEFHKLNVARQHEAFAPAHSLTALVVCVQEEVGELASAVLGVTGEKKRKAHLTNADVLDAVADAITYLSLVAAAVGCEDLEALLGDTFNMVSQRADSEIMTRLGQKVTTLQSPCGPVEIPRPTRAALIASARDWAQQIRLEDAHDVEKISPRDCGFIATRLRRHAEKIEQALRDLAMMEEK